MVELIASFALLLMLVTFAAMSLPQYLTISTRMEQSVDAASLADILCETINAELSAAAVSPVMPGAEQAVPAAVTITPHGSPECDEITFLNADGYTVTVKIGKIDEKSTDRAGNAVDLNGRLVILYTHDDGVNSEETQWFYGEEVYMGMSISDMNFTPVEDIPLEATPVIKLELTLIGADDKVYLASRYIACRNLSSSAVKVDDTVAP